VSEGHYSYRFDRQRLVREAEALGVSVEGGRAAIADRVADAKQELIDRAGPCRGCGASGVREQRFKCDGCAARYRRELEALCEESRDRARLRRETEVARYGLSMVQRWSVEHDEFSSPEELRRAALGEVE